MKKLLSLLASASMVATAGMAVVACGTNSSDDTDQTTILQNSKLGDIDANKILDDITDQSRSELIFGDKGTAVKTYLNYAAEAFMANADKLQKQADTWGKTHPDAASYVDKNVWNAINDDYKNRQKTASDSWDKAQRDANDKYGDKKWKSEWLKDLQNQFGENIYNEKDKKYEKTTDYSQYKDLYISYNLLNGASGGKSLIDSLKDDIYSWSKGPDGQDTTSIISVIRAQLLNKNEINIGDKRISFSTYLTGNDEHPTAPLETKANGKAADDKDGHTMLGQMNMLIDALKTAYESAKQDTPENTIDKMDGNAQTVLGYLINMINLTGGYNMETQTKENFLISKMEWASKENIYEKVLSANADGSWADKLIKRWDQNFDKDFGATPKGKTTSSSNLIIAKDYDVTNQIQTIYNEPGKLGSSSINGLFSNTQRFVANDYFQVEKPVAVSELVVKPLYTNGAPDMGQFITNKSFVGNDANGQSGLMDNLYKLLGNFIDNTISPVDGTSFSTANTAAPKDGTSDYSWDDLMINGLSKINDVASQAAFSSNFTGNVSFTSHSNLLTRDSSSSDYSDLLKYSVYDYLQNGGTNNILKFNSASIADTANSNDMSSDAFKTQVGDKTAATVSKEFNLITNFVDELNRGTTVDGKNKSIYKVVNSKQGIIAFIDKDGIHFVRIEGYGLLDPTGTGAKIDGTKILKPQTQLNPQGLTGANSDTVQGAYHAAQLLNSDLSSKDTNMSALAAKITSDYLADDTKITYPQQITGVKYSDLNNSFGNKYLQFLANTSIPKSLGVSNPKYSYDLNAELGTYTSTDITSDNLANSASMLSLVWNYISTITGLDDTQLMDFVETSGKSLDDNNADKTKSLIFDFFRNVSLDSTTEDKFVKKYEAYIMQGIGGNTTAIRENKSVKNFVDNLEKADKTLSNGTKWEKNTTDEKAFHPSATFKPKDKDSTWYQTSADALDQNSIWMPSNSSAAPDKSGTKGYVINANVKYEYRTEMSKFIPNAYALKGGEE